LAGYTGNNYVSDNGTAHLPEQPPEHLGSGGLMEQDTVAVSQRYLAIISWLKSGHLWLKFNKSRRFFFLQPPTPVMESINIDAFILAELPDAFATFFPALKDLLPLLRLDM
jgi:hypothetical protein